MTPHAYDQRPLSEIRYDLLGSDPDQIDTVNALIVLCDRISQLEERVEAMDRVLTSVCSTVV